MLNVLENDKGSVNVISAMNWNEQEKRDLRDFLLVRGRYHDERSGYDLETEGYLWHSGCRVSNGIQYLSAVIV